MFKPLLAASLLAAPAAIAIAQPASPSGQWTLEVAPSGCIVHSASANGTVLSIWGSAGDDTLRFLVQNRGWQSLADGENYPLQVSFDGQRAWPMDATARLNLDSDGPGLTFAVSPDAQSGGASFVEQFAEAEGMQIARDGERVGTLSLADPRVAMKALAQCLREVIATGGEGSAEPVMLQLSAEAKAI
jgi:hypothetical protein